MTKKIFTSLLLVFIMSTWLVPISANASTSSQSISKSTVSIYDGGGSYIGEFESFEEFQLQHLGINPDERGPAAWLLTASAVYGVVSMINDFSYIMTGVDIKVWIRNNISVPVYNELKKMKLYSVSGGIQNPYPPNSYQYHTFNRTNYYWVI